MVHEEVRGHLLWSVLSFHDVGPGGQTCVVRHGIRHLYVLSALTGPQGPDIKWRDICR